MSDLAWLRSSILASLGVAAACSRETPSITKEPVKARDAAPRVAEVSDPKCAERAKKLALVCDALERYHRPSAVSCAAPAPVACDPKDFAECSKHCKSGDCVKGVVEEGAFKGQQRCLCQQSCAKDSDCKSDEACLCADSGPPRCIHAECHTDGDCGSGRCELSEFFNGCSTRRAFACRSAKDLCKANIDCTAITLAPSTCAFINDHWECAEQSCEIGRPLFVAGELRRPETIGAANDHRWLAIARMEHASIASFAVFTLELLALGAPLHLLRDAQHAALDEIAHAEFAFARAGAVAGPLDLRGVMPRGSVEEIASALVEEGCIGETIGCAEAARDPEMKTIARDEQRHASLAWRTLQWMLGAYPEQTELGIAQAVSRTRYTSFRARVVEEVVVPCLRALT